MKGRRTFPWIGRRAGRAVPGREGFTLTEIMVVLLILAIGVMPLALVQSRARTEVMQSDRMTQAAALAQARLEIMKGAGFGNAVADTGQVGQLQYATQVQNVTFGLDRIQVTINWFDGRRNQSLVVSDLLSMR
jgi:prepilin-type N-terminal cleavage/methylation domain-containing protein